MWTAAIPPATSCLPNAPPTPPHPPPPPSGGEGGGGGKGGVTSCTCDLSAATVNLKLPSSVWPPQVFALCRSHPPHPPHLLFPPSPTHRRLQSHLCEFVCGVVLLLQRKKKQQKNTEPMRMAALLLTLPLSCLPPAVCFPPPTPHTRTHTTTTTSTPTLSHTHHHPNPLAEVFICQQQSLKQVSVSMEEELGAGAEGGVSAQVNLGSRLQNPPTLTLPPLRRPGGQAKMPCSISPVCTGKVAAFASQLKHEETDEHLHMNYKTQTQSNTLSSTSILEISFILKMTRAEWHRAAEPD